MTDRLGAEEDRLVVYCRSWCGDCARARRWLDARGISYVEIDVEEDSDARAFAESLNGGSLHTPTFTYGEGACVDFDEGRLCALLGID